MQTFLNNSSSRGLRNNNPGNLIRTSSQWKGKIPFSQSKDSHFEQFTDIAWGIRAFFIDVMGDIKEGTNTLVKLITEYAPEFENNTQAYINNVSYFTGWDKNAVIPLTKSAMFTLAKAKFRVELGENYSSKIDNATYEEAWNRLDNKYKPKENTLGATCEKCGRVLAGIGAVLLTLWVFKL